MEIIKLEFLWKPFLEYLFWLLKSFLNVKMLFAQKLHDTQKYFTVQSRVTQQLI